MKLEKIKFIKKKQQKNPSQLGLTHQASDSRYEIEITLI
jgi:hypothetical protein